MKQVIVYTQTGCRPCEELKLFLEGEGISYEARNLTTEPEHRTSAAEFDIMSTPATVIDGKVIMGVNREAIIQALAE